jgi:hypothetical protein
MEITNVREHVGCSTSSDSSLNVYVVGLLARTHRQTGEGCGPLSDGVVSA